MNSIFAKILGDSIVWDNHACMPLRPNDPSFLPQLARVRSAGVNVITLNVAYGKLGQSRGPCDARRIPLVGAGAAR